MVALIVLIGAVGVIAMGGRIATLSDDLAAGPGGLILLVALVAVIVLRWVVSARTNR